MTDGMKIKLAAILILIGIALVSRSCHAADRWTWYDTALEVVYESYQFADWRTTREFTGSPHEYPNLYETNKVLGAHPSARRVNVYMAGTMILHPVIAYFLPRPIREGFIGASIYVEKSAVEHNRSAGITLSFKLF